MSWLSDAKTGRFAAIDPVDLLYANTKFSSDCWEWQGDLNSKGYGRVSVNRNQRRSRLLAHRVAF